jgi:hypothetical protein
MVSIFTIVAGLLIVYGLYRLFKGAYREGATEIIIGIAELIGQLLVTLL